MVLLWIKHLEQRGRGVSLVPYLQLVYLVEHEHRVRALGAHDALYDPAGHRADVCAPVSTNLRLVPHPSEAHPDKLSAESAGDALP